MDKVGKLSGTVLSLFLIVAVLSEIFLLNQNFTLKEKISAYHHLEGLLSQLQIRYDEINYERSFEGKCLPFFMQQQMLGQKNASSVTVTKSPRYIVMFYFSIHDSRFSLINEITNWNKFTALYDDSICQVIGITDTVDIGNSNNMHHSMKIEFPILKIPNLHYHLSEYGITSTPAAFFIDGSSQKIIYTYFPTTLHLSSKEVINNILYSDDFINKLQLILDTCK